MIGRAAARRRLVLPVAALVALLAGSRMAQPAAPDLGNYQLLRQWPASDEWGVALAQGADTELWCLVGTGSQSTDETGLFKLGLAMNEAATRVFRSAKDGTSLGGPSLKLMVDGYAIATLPVKWRGPVEDSQAVVGLIMGIKARDGLVNLLRVGETMEIATATASASVVLTGFRNQHQNLEACLQELGLLNASKRTLQAPRPQGVVMAGPEAVAR